MLGPFEIVAKLGEGGMGEVYRANDTRLKRTVAIKVVAQSAADEPDASRLDRFQQEARAIARINHSGICALYDVGQDGQTTFLVMEYVQGDTLSSRLAGGPLALGVALRTAAQIADALDHAHRQGVTHRDLKPANIMLTRDGVKILDFGLAKMREDPAARALSATLTAPAPLTEVGTIVGTLPYMSPEQVEGRAVDARSDIFSFGVVLYEMLTGRRPFAGDSRISLMAAIVATDAPRASTLQAAVPPALDRVIARCLAKDPDNRWQDARDLAAELRWVAESGSGASPAATASAPRRSRSVMLAAGLAAVAIAAAAIAAAMMLRRSDASVPTFSPVTFRRGIVTSARFARDGQSIVYSGSWQGGPHEVYVGQAGTADARSLQLAEGRILGVSQKGDLAVHFGPHVITPEQGMLARVPFAGGARRDVLDRVIDADWVHDTDDFAVVRAVELNKVHLEFPIGTKVHEAPAIWSLRVSPDGGRVAFFEGDAIFSTTARGALTVIDRRGRKSTLARDLVALGLAWAPSGNEVWFTASMGRFAPSIFAASISGRIREVYHAPDWLVLHDIAEDGRVLVSRNTIRIGLSCQARGDTTERDLTWLFASAVNAISPNGQTVVFVESLGTDEPQVFRRRLDGTPAVPVGLGTPAQQGLSPNGAWVLMHRDDGLALLPTGAGSAVSLSRGKIARIEEAGWVDDTQVAFTGIDDTTSDRPRIYVQSIPDGLPRAVTAQGIRLAPRAVSPDGRSILGLSTAGWHLFPLDQGLSHPVPGLVAREQPLQWSSDGRFLYVRPGGRTTSLNIYRVDVTTAHRELWKTLAPDDRVGIDNINPVVLTPDATAYCYSHTRRLGDLFVADGLK